MKLTKEFMTNLKINSKSITLWIINHETQNLQTYKK